MRIFLSIALLLMQAMIWLGVSAQPAGLEHVFNNEKRNNLIQKLNRLNKEKIYRGDEFSVIIGYVDPDEKLVVTLDSVITGNVLMLNNGILEVAPGVRLTIEGSIFMLDSTRIHSSGAEFVLNGDLVMTNKSHLAIADGRFEIDMQYRYQYSILAMDTSDFRLTGSKADFGQGSWNGTFLDHATLHLENDSFDRTVTMLMKNRSNLYLLNVYNAWEFLLADSVNVNISRSQNLILWFYAHHNQKVEFSFPQGIWLENFTLNNTQPGRTEVGYHVVIDSTANVNWGILQESNSDVTLVNSYMRTFGLIEDHGGADTLEGFVNKSFYAEKSFSTSTQQIHLENTFIET